MPPLLEVRLEPNWHAVKAAWQLCLAALEGGGLDRDHALTLSIAAQELLENAVKYGKFDGASNVELRIDRAPDAFRLQVRNPVGDATDIEELRGVLDWLRSQPNPLLAYQARMREMAQADPPKTGGLGLARISYESGCALECALEDGNVVVRATYRF